MIRELSGAVERTAQVCEFRQGLSKQIRNGLRVMTQHTPQAEKS